MRRFDAAIAARGMKGGLAKSRGDLIAKVVAASNKPDLSDILGSEGADRIDALKASVKSALAATKEAEARAASAEALGKEGIEATARLEAELTRMTGLYKEARVTMGIIRQAVNVNCDRFQVDLQA